MPHAVPGPLSPSNPGAGDTTTSTDAVCFVLPGYAPHPVGGNRVVLQYANHLASRGVRVTVLSSRRFLRHTPKAWASLPLARETWAYAREAAGIRRGRPVPWFDVHPAVRVVPSVGLPDYIPGSHEVVVATAVDTAFWVADLVERHRGSGAYLIQHYEDWAAPAAFVDATWRLGLRNIVVSDSLREVGRRLDVPTTLVRNGLDVDTFPSGSPAGLRARSVLAMVSDVPFKRTDLVCEVFTRLRESHPDTPLRTFGVCERPPGLPAGVEHVREPSRARLAQMYRDTRVFFSASDSEGFGLPLAEAVLSGAACASTDSGGVTDVLSGRIPLTPPGDAGALLRAVVGLLEEDPATCSSRAESARSALTGHTVDDAAAAFADALGVKST